MRKGIHPKFYTDTVITDNSTGKVFPIGSTVENMVVEISSLSHPFYTGKQRIVDTDNRVDRFTKRQKKTDITQVQKKKRKVVERRTSSVQKVEKVAKLTLRDMLKDYR